MFKNYDISIINIFKKAESEREKLNHEYVGTEHLLLAILSLDSIFVNDLKKFNLDYDSFYKKISNNIPKYGKKVINNIYTPLLKRVIYTSSLEDNISEKTLLFHILDEGEGVAIRVLIEMDIDVDMLYNFIKDVKYDTSNLEIYKIGKLLNNYVDLNEKTIGREKEINLLIYTLLRKKKNNPILLGDAGTGKTAIVEELARRISLGLVPEKLLDTKIVMLEMGNLVSGTRYRGEFEERLTKIIEEVQNNPNIILFIDEIHTMINAGAAEGAISASDILKPYLARGDVKCIGATTNHEYEKFIETDKALLRRFEPIIVSEPNETETCNILKQIKGEYESFHKIGIKDDTIDILVHLANVYFPNRKNPDKAIELLDSVMSYVKIKNQNSVIKKKEEELKKITFNKIQNIETGNYKEALKNNIIENKLKKELLNIQNGIKLLVSKDDIIDLLEYKNNIILNKNKIKNIKMLNEKYDKKCLNLITNNLSNSDNHIKSFMFINEPKNFIKDLSEQIGYNIIKITSELSISKMYKKIKYNPNTIIVVSDLNIPGITSILNKVVKDNMIEYEDEYINFSNAILIILSKNKKIGFNNDYYSPIPINQIINFENQILVN